MANTISRRAAVAATLAAPIAISAAAQSAAALEHQDPGLALAEEFEQKSLEYLRLGNSDVDFTDEQGDRMQNELCQLSRKIQQLPYDAPGGLRAKAAAGLYWFDHGHDSTIRREIFSDGYDTSAHADLAHAAALTFCPAYATEVMAMQEAHLQRVAIRRANGELLS